MADDAGPSAAAPSPVVQTVPTDGGADAVVDVEQADAPPAAGSPGADAGADPIVVSDTERDFVNLSDVDEDMPTPRRRFVRRRYIRGFVLQPQMVASTSRRLNAAERRSKREREQVIQAQEERMRKFLECRVCMEEFDDGPHAMMATPCGHVLCKSCTGPIWEKKECPTCRKRLARRNCFIRLFL